MAMEEPQRKQMNCSLMDSGRMDSYMDMEEPYYKMVNVMNLNTKMGKALESSDFKRKIKL
jgi:hypothetical protein